ncbi:MAG: efflux RND transporter periplasmic adaptor subunit [Thermoanaerobaculales bacterium]|nr:efflux RND transporter periplasmic adaptor subunit [Thermoanaerobaculales bacterium]
MSRTLGLFLAAVAAVGCGGAAGTEPGAAAPVAISTVAVRRQPVERTITVVGTFEPVAKVAVAAQEEGVVTAVRVREGDRVRGGEVVVELDDRELLAELAEARANLEEADAALHRAQRLHETGLASAQELDAAVARQRVSAARVEALGTRLSFTRIEAPVAGVVTARLVEVGDLASPRGPLLELASGQGLLLRVPVSELDVVRLQTGDAARVSIDALPELEVVGRIERIYPAADAASRQVTVELKVEDVPAGVRYGFLARAHLVLERLPDALLVPEAVLQRGAEGEPFVWVVVEGAARMRAVTVGHRLEGEAVVTSGLADGELVVSEGIARLKEGAPVTAAAPSPGAAS